MVPGAEPDENRKDIELGTARLVRRAPVVETQRLGGASERGSPEDAGVRRAVFRRDAADCIGRLHPIRRTARRASGVGTEPRDTREPGRVSVRGDAASACAARVVHARGAGDEGHPGRRRTASTRVRALSPAVPCGRADRLAMSSTSSSRGRAGSESAGTQPSITCRRTCATTTAARRPSTFSSATVRSPDAAHTMPA